MPTIIIISLPIVPLFTELIASIVFDPIILPVLFINNYICLLKIELLIPLICISGWVSTVTGILGDNTALK